MPLIMSRAAATANRTTVLWERLSEPEVAEKQLNGAQTQSLIATIAQFSSGQLTEGQTVNLISTVIDIAKADARDLLNGKAD